MKCSDKLENARERSTSILSMAAIGSVPLVILACWWVGSSWLPAGVAAVIAVAGFFAARGATGPVARIIVGQSLVGQAISMAAAFSGHPWQLDMHMTFFVAMAAMVAMVDLRALVIAALTIMVHHLSLSIVWPALIYPAADVFGNISRALVHSAIVAVETVALALAIGMRLQIDQESVEREKELAKATSEALEAKGLAEQAFEDAILDKRRVEEAMAAAETASARAQEENNLALAAHSKHVELERVSADLRTVSETQRQTVVDALQTALNKLALGDLDADILTVFAEEYEGLRHDFNRAVLNLREAIGEGAVLSAKIRGEAQGISEASCSLSSRTEREAASLETTAAAIEELTVNVRTANETAREAAAKAATAAVSASEGRRVVGEAIKAMREIEEASSGVARVTSVIHEIAFQTNLLALNAGVEAARAGDAGRGFAVVAAEVRALAQRSSEAAREINELIETSEKRVSEGVLLVGDTEKSLDEIASTVSEISGFMDQISMASSQQTAAFNEISTAVSDLDGATQKNVAMSLDTNVACSELTQLAERLAVAMAQFVGIDRQSADKSVAAA